MQKSTRNTRMNKAQELIVRRAPRFVAGNLVGTLVDTLVLWVFSHYVFHNYVGKVVLSPIISFECAVLINYLVCFHFTWKDRITYKSRRAFFRRYAAYNASCTGGFVIKLALLLLIQELTKWDVVICNLLALCVSGIFNFTMDEFVVFKKKKG